MRSSSSTLLTQHSSLFSVVQFARIARAPIFTSFYKQGRYVPSRHMAFPLPDARRNDSDRRRLASGSTSSSLPLFPLLSRVKYTSSQAKEPVSGYKRTRRLLMLGAVSLATWLIAKHYVIEDNETRVSWLAAICDLYSFLNNIVMFTCEWEMCVEKLSFDSHALPRFFFLLRHSPHFVVCFPH